MRTKAARHRQGRPHLFQSIAVRVVGIAALLGLVTTTATGCGPILSTYLILSAQAEIDGAEAAEAEEYAPYHYTAANAYITKAREEQGYADFGPAVEYAWKAKDHAEMARERADKAKKELTPPEQVPATEIDVSPTAPQNKGPAPVIIRKNDGSGQ